MQKKLLGMAVAAALAAPALAIAQSSVQVYGTVHMSLNHTRFGQGTAGAATANSVSKFAVNSHSSNWGLRSTENLGGGMSAWFQAEFNMQMERRGDTLASTNSSHRNSGVGLRGSFGNVYFGTWESPWAQTFRLWDVGTIGGWGPTTSIIGRRETTNLGTSRNGSSSVYGGGAGGSSGVVGGAPAFAAGGTNLGYPLWRRFSSSVFYESPIFSGFQFKLALQPNELKASNTAGTVENPSAWSGSLAWTGMGGKARAFLANMRAKDWSRVGASDSGWTLGGGYDFGVANLGATYERYTYKVAAGDVKAKQLGLGLSVPMGPGRIGASYARASDLTGPGVAAVTDTKAKMWNVGYEWALSKRTQLGFGVAKIDNGNNAGFTWTGQTAGSGGTLETVAAGQDQRNVFVSIRHSF